jgi:hypothetical protein
MADSAGDPPRSTRGGARAGAGRKKKTPEQKAADAAAKANLPPKRKYTKKKDAKVAENTDDEEAANEAAANGSDEERPKKRAKTESTNKRFKPDMKHTLVDHPDKETDAHRTRIQELVGSLHTCAEQGVYVIRPFTGCESRQLWMKYCGDWDSATDMIKWLKPRYGLINAICTDDEFGVKVS